MTVQRTALAGVCLLEPRLHGDERGWFLENWNQSQGAEHGLPAQFAQANTSRSRRGVLRGLHYQWPEPQGKLVWVTEGAVFDVAVDIRPDSAQFGQWFGIELSAENHRQLWVPEGFAHGFLVLSDSATFSYLCTRVYRAEYDAGIAWDDPDIGIEWPMQPTELSDKDRNAPRLGALHQSNSEALPRCASC
ncbi:MAG: dTDP-4-dehydrorhamnose 3,5-epimerase [Pseudomonadota bacterium]